MAFVEIRRGCQGRHDSTPNRAAVGSRYPSFAPIQARGGKGISVSEQDLLAREMTMVDNGKRPITRRVLLGGDDVEMRAVLS